MNTNKVYQDGSLPVAVETFYQQWSFDQANTFNEPFTQATFYNYDASDVVTINNFPIPANTAHVISLNTNQVNCTPFKIKSGSASRNLWIAWSVISGFDPRAPR